MGFIMGYALGSSSCVDREVEVCNPPTKEEVILRDKEAQFKTMCLTSQSTECKNYLLNQSYWDAGIGVIVGLLVGIFSTWLYINLKD